jgi:hypothetical protein
MSTLFFSMSVRPRASSLAVVCRDVVGEASLPCRSKEFRRARARAEQRRQILNRGKINRRRAAKTTESKAQDGAGREKGRRLQAPKARGRDWLATAVPCCLWAGEDKRRQWRQKCGRCFFFFFTVEPHRCRRRKALGADSGKKPSPKATLKV